MNGRYKCNETNGQRICLDGWFGPNCTYGKFSLLKIIYNLKFTIIVFFFLFFLISNFLEMSTPRLTMPFDGKIQFLEGSSVTMKCETTSNPEPTHYIWYHNNRTIGNTSSHFLTLSNLTMTQQGGYQCEAVNEYARKKSDHFMMLLVWSKSFPIEKFRIKIRFHLFNLFISILLSAMVNKTLSSLKTDIQHGTAFPVKKKLRSLSLILG